MTRAELYRFIAQKRSGLNLTGVPVRAVDIVLEHYPSISLCEKDFGTRAIGGMLLLGQVSLLCLNTRRTEVERNFDCAHELVHFWSGMAHYSLSPEGLPVPRQERYIEWVANEGAAELLMPLHLVLPLFYHERIWRYSGTALRRRLEALAGRFFVTPAQMEFRLRSLTSELGQYSRTLSCRGIEPRARYG